MCRERIYVILYSGNCGAFATIAEKLWLFCHTRGRSEIRPGPLPLKDQLPLQVNLLMAPGVQPKYPGTDLAPCPDEGEN